jgi:hypothetical protein
MIASDAGPAQDSKAFGVLARASPVEQARHRPVNTAKRFPSEPVMSKLVRVLGLLITGATV